MEIIERRQQERIRLEELRRQRGADTLDGKPADNAAIAEAEAAIEALDDAETEAVRRQRRAAEAAHAERVATLRSELQDIEAARLKATEQAETAARAMADALRLVLRCADQSRKVMAQLGGIRPAFDMTEHGLHEHLSRRLAAQIKTIAGQPSGFGLIRFGSSALPDPARAWTD